MLGKFLRVSLLSGLLPAALASAQIRQLPLRGFTPARSEKERALEKQFMALPDPAKAEAHHKILTTEPHMAGSPADRRTAEYVLQQFRSYGLEADIEEFPVVLSEPGEVKLALLEPVKFSGPTSEFVAEDPVSKDRRAAIGFNAFSGSGEATANVVYANYGLPNDYDLLRSKGVSMEGKIVIVRYGECYRGVKAMVAEEHKAAGVIIYSDPQDDGYHAGAAYPKGPWRPASGVQRGSVLYDFIYPGVAADGSNVPHIPVLPLSYADARHILEHLAGPVAPRGWQGGLPFTYRLGPGPAKVRMQVHLKSPRRAVWDVVGKVRGTEEPEEIVIAGNHRDAWVYGGVDPNSGTTAMLEMARGLGVLVKEGWRPRRSIWLCSWDAEEPDEFGSTEWAEKHFAELNLKAVAYLNLDSAVAGDRFGASATPSLKKFLLEVAADVLDPKGGSVLENANLQLREQFRRELTLGNSAARSAELKPISQQTIEIGNLGSGTDYVSFFDHLGIPSTDFGFESEYGVYHSIFDNHRWMKKFGDPKFLYHVAAARFYGLETLRLAEADLLPFDYQTYGQEIQNHLSSVDKKLVLLGRAGGLDLEAARQAAQELTRAGKELRERCDSVLADDSQSQHFYPVNRAVVGAEKALLLPNGLPRRPWFRHAVFAPGFYNGYDAVPLPGVHESIDADNFEEASRQLEALTEALNRATDVLKTAVLEGLK